MDMVAAAKDTLALAESGAFRTIGPEGTDLAHMQEMVSKMEASLENDTMSPAKLGRWLGWLQCAAVVGSFGRITLDDCKRINMSHA